jgi:hypothetical protein
VAANREFSQGEALRRGIVYSQVYVAGYMDAMKKIFMSIH